MSRMFSRIPGFHPLDASSAPFPPSCDNSECLQTLPKLPLAENHWPDITALLFPPCLRLLFLFKTLFEIRKDKMHPNNMTIDMTNPYLMVKIGIQLRSCIIFWPKWRVEIPPINPSWLFQVKRNQGASNFWKPAVFERFCLLDCSPNPSPKIFDFWLRMKRTM